MCLFWTAALVIPLTITAFVRGVRLDWTAIPAGLLAIGCVRGVRFFHRLGEKIVWRGLENS